MSVSVRPAAGDPDMQTVRELFVEYQDAIGVDLCFQGFEAELAGLPGPYAPPAGGLWLAEVDGAAIGVIGMRPIEDDCCEMKRLYVRPPGRGQGLGRRLAVISIEAGRAAGYRAMRLDTLPQMQTAQALYRDLGFVETAAYRENPVEGVTYMILELADR